MIPILYLPIIYGVSLEVYIFLIFLTIPYYLICHWILKRFIFNSLIRNIVTWTCTFGLALITYIGIIEIFMFTLSREPSRDFDQSKWMTNKEERFEMADDLINRKVLIDRDSSQIIQLLGIPLVRDSLNLNWIYDLGSGGGGFGFLFHQLRITFDKNKAIKVEHIRIPD